jgi:hypothetical protein
MKLNPKIPIKRTKKLFLDKYSYKVVIISALASMFRGNDLDSVSKKLAYYRVTTNNKPVQYWSRHMSTNDIDLAENILHQLNPMSDYVLRVEAPLISVYTNNLEDIKKITDNLTEFVKYVSLSENELEKGIIYLKKIDFDYKITLGHIRTPQDSLVKWCDNNSKIRMPKTCKEQLKLGWGCKQRYFYVKDDRSLIMVKMFLGSNIQRIDRVVKLDS